MVAFLGIATRPPGCSICMKRVRRGEGLLFNVYPSVKTFCNFCKSNSCHGSIVGIARLHASIRVAVWSVSFSINVLPSRPLSSPARILCGGVVCEPIVSGRHFVVSTRTTCTVLAPFAAYDAIFQSDPRSARSAMIHRS